MINYSHILQTGEWYRGAWSKLSFVPVCGVRQPATAAYITAAATCTTTKAVLLRCAGIQSLLAVACGWGCGRWEVVDAEPTVAYTNTLVLRFCIPCLQIWLLAVKTDMQQAENWRWVS